MKIIVKNFVHWEGIWIIRTLFLLNHYFLDGDGPGGIRTRDLQLRRLPPYPGSATGPNL